MVLNIYRREGINSYFTENVLSLRAQSGVQWESGSKKSARRRQEGWQGHEFMDSSCGFV